MIAVYGTDEFVAWFESLSERDAEDVIHVVRLLEQLGLRLGEPHSSAIKGASFALRELRRCKGHSPIRVFYAFDPEREAILLLGGDKSGMSTARFYREMIAVVERIWREYLTETTHS